MRGEGSKFLGLSHLIFGAAEQNIFVGATVNSCDTHDFLQRGCNSGSKVWYSGRIYIYITHDAHTSRD